MSETLHTKKMETNWMLLVIISKKHRLYRHLILIVFSIIVLYYSPPEYKEPYETYSRAVTFFQILFLAYSNMYFFVPRFLFKKKYLSYGLAILASIIVSGIIHRTASYFLRHNLLPYEEDSLNFLTFSFSILVLTVASASVKLFQQWIQDAQLIYDLEQAKTNAELEQLKNQINPHFLFNMLNNANVLTKKDPDKASEVLVKLSDLLRYQLYDSSRLKVLLTSDIHFLEDFLNLEKVRRDNFHFMISKEGNLSGVQIPPLLFITFVENAVKHNNDASRQSYVHLYFDIIDNELYFKCVNSKPTVKAVKKTGGLGLANIKRRLELLFPLSHMLKIEDEQETYTVTLIIKI
ncbi:sensor histidine kinase [Flavobacterium sp. RHBU_3]|uniref:sensor histidine kinase n=1 Tax=Flavobacterium sp. RHBU_3 TaxID=3391184 RepID=UPI003984CA27